MFQIITNGKRKKKPISVYSITQKKGKGLCLSSSEGFFMLISKDYSTIPWTFQALREMFMYSIFIFNVTHLN